MDPGSKFSAQVNPASTHIHGLSGDAKRGPLSPRLGERQITIGFLADRLDGAVASAGLANGLVTISVPGALGRAACSAASTKALVKSSV